MNRRQWTIVIVLALAAGFLGGLCAGGAMETTAEARLRRENIRAAYQPRFGDWLQVWGHIKWVSRLNSADQYETRMYVEETPKGSGDYKVRLVARVRPDHRADFDRELESVKERIRTDLERWNRYYKIDESDLAINVADWQ